MVVQPRGTGWIEVICGPMFSGKTEELIRRLRRAEIAKQPVQVFKPVVDDRYSVCDIVSHNERRANAVTVHSAAEVIERLDPETEVVAIDEAQFFDARIVEVAEQLANAGRRVIVAGLDTDFRSVPFDPMPGLIAVAEYVTKLLAICVDCGSPANRSQRVAGGTSRVEVGAKHQYEARCRRCFEAYRAEETTGDEAVEVARTVETPAPSEPPVVLRNVVAN